MEINGINTGLTHVMDFYTIKSKINTALNKRNRKAISTPQNSKLILHYINRIGKRFLHHKIKN